MSAPRLTPAQAYHAAAALDSYLEAGDWGEQLVMFDSPQGVRAAHAARDKLTVIAMPYIRARLKRGWEREGRDS